MRYLGLSKFELMSGLLLVAAAFCFLTLLSTSPAGAVSKKVALSAPAVSNTIVISQVYGGGGNAGAPYTNDFVELFNRGNTTVDVTGWSVQYNSATGTGAFQVTAICPTGPCLIPAGGYFLVQEGGGANGVALPTPNATGTIAMSATTGRVAVVNSVTAIPASATCATQLASVDFVGYGNSGSPNFTTPICFEGSAPAPLISNTTSDQRFGGGCQDTDQNSVDFFVASPLPRNSATTAAPCGANTTPARNRRADFDADGKSDVSVWNSTNHNWYILQSSMGNSLKTVVDWGNGSLGDVAVPGDYDGDNKTDTAVFRPSENNWYIIRSSTNTPTVVNWGATGDIPVPGDYDGDGLTDIAVWRPTTGNWHILSTQFGVQVRTWGNNGDTPVP